MTSPVARQSCVLTVRARHGSMRRRQPSAGSTVHRNVRWPAAPGHGVAALLKIYSHCVDERADAANKRITDALGVQDTRPESERGDEGGDDSERAILKCQVRGKKSGGSSA
jgi:hypothetical protein